MTAVITFYGGARSVTGANFLFDTGDKKILIDCGSQERENICDPKNAEHFSYDAHSIDVLIITHAHQDHIGRVPKLIREGFKGVIFSTPATRDLSEIMFNDALSVMRFESERLGCEPLYGPQDVEKSLSLWHTHEYHEPFAIGDTQIEFLDAGHILGSAMARLSRGNKKIIFTGDLGNSPEPLLNDTESPEGADYILMESVYGDRLHEGIDERRDILRFAIEGARERKSTLLIPSFSLERTQILLYEIHSMIEAGVMEPIPIYLDAPLAIQVTEVFKKYIKLFNPKAQEEFAHTDAFMFPKLVETEDSGHSKKIHKKPDPKVIIAGAGMSAGGRIRAHEKEYLPDENAGLLFTGYQAPGSLGRRIQEGEKRVLIDGENIEVRAHIDTLTGYSGHKDRDELLAFVENASTTLQKVFVVMGEPKASMFLAQRIKEYFGIEAVVPEQSAHIDVDF